MLFSAIYAENRDAIFISMKTFNENPIDTYPTFTLCFQGDKFHWYHDDNIFDSYGLNATQYEIMLKSGTAMKDELNKTSGVYSKTPVIFNDGENVNFDQFHLKTNNFVHELKYFTEGAINDAHYISDQHGNASIDAYLNLSYQTATRICFTRTSDDALKSIRLEDLVTFNGSIMGHKRYKNTEIQVFIHAPNQLVVSLDKPKYRASFEHLTSSLYGVTGKNPQILEFKVSQVKQLRKRPDSNTPCNENILDYDLYYQMEIVEKLRCVPPYWKRKFFDENKTKECTSPTKIQEAHRMISDPKSILKLKELPCTEMILMSLDSINYEPTPKPKDISIAFFYTEKTYEEIQYNRMMGFESWLSNTFKIIALE